MEKHSSGDMMTCPFCDSTYILSDYFSESNSKYDYIIPFSRSSRDDVLEQFYTICDEKFAPNDFRTTAHINYVKNFFLPLYLFKTHSKVHYTLEVGHRVTRRQYNTAKQMYEDVSETVWESRNGNFSDKFFIETRGFSDTKCLIDDDKHLDRVLNLTLMTVTDTIIKKDIGSGKYEPYNPIKLNKGEVVPSISQSDAWLNEGSKCLYEKIESHIRSLYSGDIRNIHFTSDDKIKSITSELVPFSLVSYNYKNPKERVVVFDGIDGQIHQGYVPISKKMFLLMSAGVFFSAGLITAGMAIPLLDNYKNYDKGIGITICLVALAIVIMLWLFGLKGTGGNRESSAAKSNKSKSIFYGIISAVLSIIAACFLISGYDSHNSGFDTSFKKNNSTTTTQRRESSTTVTSQDHKTYSIEVDEFCKIMKGVWIDASSVVDLGYDVDFTFCYFENREICFGQYCGHVGQKGTIEKVEYDDSGNYSITVHYPLIDNEAEYYEERYDTIKMVMYRDHVMFGDIECYRWGIYFEEATAALREAIDRKK
ncbi:MAG: hypothetical protein ACI4YB_04780 [Oscillospiraceae bacterium]